MLPKGLLKTHAVLLTWISKLFDLGLFLLAGLIAFYLRFDNFAITHEYLIAFLFAGFLVLTVFPFFGVYLSLRGRSLTHYFGRLYVAIICVMFLLATIGFVTKTGSVYSRGWYLVWFFVAVILLTVFRILMRLCLSVLRKKGWNHRRVVIIGSGGLAVDLAKRAKAALWSGFRVVSLLGEKKQLTLRATDSEIGELPENLATYLTNNDIDEVWLALPIKEEKRFYDILHDLRYSVVTIRFFPDMFGMQLLNHSTTDIFGLPAINLVSTPMIGVNRLIKWLEDVVLSSIILLLISPILLVIAILVKLSSPGPIFYRQERMSWNGKKFNMLKFRSMPVNAESQSGAVWAKKEDQRATKIGIFLRKTSLDELPQFINVLKGDMSIVGPRPERPVFVEQFKDEIPNYMQKHLVKAGITGWAQVNGWRGNTDLHKRIEYDIYYIEHWSLWVDLKIILLTFIRGFIHKNAY